MSSFFCSVQHLTQEYVLHCRQNKQKMDILIAIETDTAGNYRD